MVQMDPYGPHGSIWATLIHMMPMDHKVHMDPYGAHGSYYREGVYKDDIEKIYIYIYIYTYCAYMISIK